MTLTRSIWTGTNYTCRFDSAFFWNLPTPRLSICRTWDAATGDTHIRMHDVCSIRSTVVCVFAHLDKSCSELIMHSVCCATCNGASTSIVWVRCFFSPRWKCQYHHITYVVSSCVCVSTAARFTHPDTLLIVIPCTHRKWKIENVN